MEEIRTGRLLLRAFRESDYDDLFEFLYQLKDDEFEGYPGINRENGAPIWKDTYVYTLTEGEELVRQRLQSTPSLRTNLYTAADSDDRALTAGATESFGDRNGVKIMKKTIAFFLAAILMLSLLAGCGGGSAPNAVNDGRARPSSCGKLRVIDGKLCSESGEPVMLRGVSSHELITAEPFLNEETFRELSQDDGVNLFRLAMYTFGVGIVGYCTGDNRERYKQDVAAGVELARQHDMYVLIDWHILSDGDPNTYIDEAKAFFSEMAEKYSGYNNVLYEICNEPNGVDWQSVKAYAEQIIPVIREKDPDSVIIVGNPQWSKDLESVAADPLAFDNVMYTLHFYAATHGQELRDMTERLSRSGLPIFVTEYGITASSGGHPRDPESADAWIELLERENISYCMWSFSKVAEACSAIRSTVPKYSGFEEDDYTETGLWLLKTLKEHPGR